MSCSLGKGNGQIAKNSGIRLGAEHGMIECPECHQRVAVKPDGWHTGWWTIEPHNQQDRSIFKPKEISERAKEVVAILNSLSCDDQYDVMVEMGWTEYDYSYG